jgi:hypothetical protein
MNWRKSECKKMWKFERICEFLWLDLKNDYWLWKTVTIRTIYLSLIQNVIMISKIRMISVMCIFNQSGQNALSLNQSIYQFKFGSSKSKISFVMYCKRSHVHMACISQNHLFMPKMQMCSLKKWHFAMRVFDEIWLCTMKDHMKCGLLKEKSPKLAIPCESYGTLNLGIFWKWMDHILLTTHGNLKFLDFLEWWDQDLQLSCWTKIHLNLVWWSYFEEKKFPFWAAEITGHLPF